MDPKRKAALKKLEAMVFARYTPAGLRIDPNTARVLEPLDRRSIGGLEYRFRDGDSHYRISIIHVESKRGFEGVIFKDFIITTTPVSADIARHPSRVRRVTEWNLSQDVKMAIVNAIREVASQERLEREAFAKRQPEV